MEDNRKKCLQKTFIILTACALLLLIACGGAKNGTDTNTELGTGVPSAADTPFDAPHTDGSRDSESESQTPSTPTDTNVTDGMMTDGTTAENVTNENVTTTDTATEGSITTERNNPIVELPRDEF